MGRLIDHQYCIGDGEYEEEGDDTMDELTDDQKHCRDCTGCPSVDTCAEPSGDWEPTEADNPFYPDNEYDWMPDLGDK